MSLFERSEWVSRAFAALLRSWRFRIWALILALLGVILAFVPLFWVLGFEFAFIIAVVVSIASIDLGQALISQLRHVKIAPSARALHSGQLLVNLWLFSTAAAFLVLAAPLAISCANALRIRNCDFLFGFKSFALLPLASTIIASAIGIMIGLITSGHRWLARALPYLIVGGSALWSIWRFYAAPPVFAYNMFAGYFPGNIYDEAIFLGGPLLWSRLYQFALIVLALAMVALFVDVPRAALQVRGPRRPGGFRIAVMVTALAALVSVTVLKLKSGQLGFAIDSDDIRGQLDSTHETAHFIIHYRGGGRIGETIELIGQDHEFRLAQLVRTLGVTPQHKITSFYFSSAAEKATWMGARQVHMAKPWRSELYINHAPFPHPVLRHEIAHVVAGEFGDPIFAVSARTLLGVPLRFNVGLIEGLAVAADWPDHFNRELTPHQSVKALTQLNMAPRLESLLSTGFIAVSSARSYTTSGSFVRYLLETYGAGPVRALYRSGGDFDSAFGVPLSELASQWRTMIANTDLPDDAADVVRERFRRRSIFVRKCPHAIARSRARVGELAGRGKLKQAIATMRSVCADVPQEPRYLLELAALLVRQRSYSEADDIYAEIAADSENVSSELRARAILRRAEIFAATERWPQALTLINEATELPVGTATKRLAVVQQFIGNQSKGDRSFPLYRYFWGTRPGLSKDPVIGVSRAAQAIALDPQSGLAFYLLGFNLQNRRAVNEATELLSRALDLGLPHPLIRREAARLLAKTAYMSGNDTAVGRAARILVEPEQPEPIRLAGADWIERLEWKQTGTLPTSAIRPQDILDEWPEDGNPTRPGLDNDNIGPAEPSPKPQEQEDNASSMRSQ